MFSKNLKYQGKFKILRLHHLKFPVLTAKLDFKNFIFSSKITSGFDCKSNINFKPLLDVNMIILELFLILGLCDDLSLPKTWMSMSR